jgi:AcrR family transcriptional regulator
MLKSKTQNSGDRKQDRAKNPDRLGREVWLARAMDAIGREARGQMSVDELVKAVGVTKGSFYWHFKNRADFVDQLLDFWITKFTISIREFVSGLKVSPVERLVAVAEAVIHHQGAKYDIAMHAWALRDPKVAQAVERAEKIRFDYLRSLFREIGFRGRELEIRTRTFVVYYSFESGLQKLQTKKNRLEQARPQVEVLTRT